MVDTLIENVAVWKDVGVFQNQSEVAEYGHRQGILLFDWSVAGEMNIQGVTALATGTYYVNYADSRNAVGDGTNDATGTASATRKIALPDNAILTRVPIVDIHKAKAGSGTITPAVGTITLTAVTSVGTSVDDGNGNELVVGYKTSAAMNISVAVAGNTVTAGAFTLCMEYIQGS